MTTVAELPSGFADKVLSAQSTFRAVMDAMARPGSVKQALAAVGAPEPMMQGTAVWVDAKMSGTFGVAKWLKFHSGAPVVDDPAICSFALIGNGAALPDL